MGLSKFVLALTLVTCIVHNASAGVIYREVFPNDSVTTGTGQQAAEGIAQGWYGQQHGGIPFTTAQSGQIAKPTQGVTPEMTPVNSNPVGPVAETGFYFWSPTNRAGIYLYTGEIAALSLNTNKLTDVSWDSRNGGAVDSNSRMRLALLVGSDWYISDQGNNHTLGSATWQSNTLSLSSLTFGLFNDHSVTEPANALPRNNDGSTGLSLPAGTLNAIGL